MKGVRDKRLQDRCEDSKGLFPSCWLVVHLLFVWVMNLRINY